MSEILNATDAAIAGDKDQPKLRLYSAHENNVAALMSAARVFQAHQPNYGATFSLELRRFRGTGKYGITVRKSDDAVLVLGRVTLSHSSKISLFPDIMVQSPCRVCCAAL